MDASRVNTDKYVLLYFMKEVENLKNPKIHLNVNSSKFSIGNTILNANSEFWMTFFQLYFMIY